MNQTSLVKAERARQNRAYVRELLRQRQPGFSSSLASAEQDLVPGPGISQRLSCGLCNMPRDDFCGMTGPSRGLARS
jgi:hypothetical protein